MRRQTPGDTQPCGCPDYQRAGFSRRSFLKRTAAVAAATGLVGSELSTQLAFASSPTYAGDVLIVLSLRGGFDGLSVVVPANDPDFHAARPNIRVPEAQLLATGDSRFGLHPAMAPLKPFWDAGTFGAVHAVGQTTNPTRSHFEATEELERAAPGTSLRTGWLDRMLGTRPGGTVFQGAYVGWSGVSDAFAGPVPVLGLASIDGFGLNGSASDGSDLPQWSAALSALNAGASNWVATPVATTLGALSTVKSMGSASDYVPGGGAVYDPASDLASALRDIARLIKANVGLQTVGLDYSDWDMHAGLSDGTLDPTKGWMHDKVSELSAALAAFFTDLGPTYTAKTSLVTLSEFGRRVQENGSNGLDHGHGNVVLLMGGGIKGGQVHGAWPGLADAALDDGDLAATTDYRNVLGELLVQRCGATAVGSSVFPGLAYTPIGIANPLP
jgi:uncharacterized protein (DUF1501 family)